ncbi:cation-binding protein [Serinicoccus chungangensis]|uniref:Cation-binding protein n=1 Tax=Serinicoccus chungangensis TaxID=767452 RepID=A0A0W8I1K1_9MICO|nr:hemerythrin domain-containing protein [Serinicoccus chungangensis]KUG51605.1 cation-binding protein [Serinicoccus chungangensis]
MTSYTIPRPVSGDVVDLILADHRLFEELMRDLRDSSADRESARQAFAAVLVAHGEAEEEKVYPRLRRKEAIDAHEAEHGEEEHAEINRALLDLLECAGTDTQKFDDAVEAMNEVLQHHLTEEELTILNPARDEVSEKDRADLGAAFLEVRGHHLDQGVGIEQVRALVEQAEEDGLLDDED